MTKHPLTNKILEKFDGYDHLRSQWLFGEEDMRAAADWQLEQVIKWAQRNCWCWFEKSSQKKSFIVELQKAMRPQEGNA